MWEPLPSTAAWMGLFWVPLCPAPQQWVTFPCDSKEWWAELLSIFPLSAALGEEPGINPWRCLCTSMFWGSVGLSLFYFFPVCTAHYDTCLHIHMFIVALGMNLTPISREPMLVAGPYLLPFLCSSVSAPVLRGPHAFKQNCVLFWSSHSSSQKNIASSSFAVLEQALNSQSGKDCYSGDCGFCTGVKARDSCAAWKMIRRYNGKGCISKDILMPIRSLKSSWLALPQKFRSNHVPTKGTGNSIAQIVS